MTKHIFFSLMARCRLLTAAAILTAGLLGCGGGDGSSTGSPSGARRGAPRTEVAVRIDCAQPGYYRLTGSQLAEAGLDPAAVDLDRATLVQGDRVIPIAIEAGDDGRFDAEDTILFYAEGPLALSRPHINLVADFDPPTQVFMLLPAGGAEPPLRYERVPMATPAEPSGDFPVVLAETRLHFEENPIWKFYEDITNELSQTDYLFWVELTNPPTDKTQSTFQTVFASPHVQVEAPARLRMQFVGVAGTGSVAGSRQHRMQIVINDRFEEIVEWPLGRRYVGEIEVPPGVLNAAGNTISFNLMDPVAPAGNTRAVLIDDVLIDWFEIDFRQETRLFNNFGQFVLKGTGQTAIPERLSILDFAGRDALVFDRTNGRQLVAEPFETAPESWIYGVNIDLADLPTTGTLQLDALTRRRLQAPAKVQKVELQGVLKRDYDCDLLVLSHPDFLEEMQRYVDWKRKRGLKVEMVNIIDVFNEVAGGEPSPDALRDFIQYVYGDGDSPLRYVLLVGDSVTISKYKTYLPAYSYLQSGQHANDNFFANFEKPDGPPAFAVGRFSVRTTEQLRNAIDKVIAYESGADPSDWRNTVLLIAASVSWAEKDAREIGNTAFTPGFRIRMLDTDQQTTDPDYAEKINAELMSLINPGNLITVFLGHGGGTVWEVGPTRNHDNFVRHLFDQSHVERMTNTNRWPLVFALTCYTNDFDNAHVSQTLGETFVNSPNGAIAVIGAAQRTYVMKNREYMNKFLELLREERFERLGDYFAEAKRALNDARSNSAYLLIGDPALEFRLPKRAIEVETPQISESGQLSFAWKLPSDAPASGRMHGVLLGDDWVLIDEWSEDYSARQGTTTRRLPEGIAPDAVRQVAVFVEGREQRDWTGGALLASPEAEDQEQQASEEPQA